MPELVEILKATAMAGASDLHLVVGKPPMVRLQGVIQPLPGLAAISADECKSMIYSILYEDQRARFEAAWELDCSFTLPGISRFRVNVFMQKNGVAAVLRTISSKIPTPQEIGLMPAMANLVDLPRGLVLVTGPTGSGKTTTLACLIELINQKHKKHVLTVEDPIEFVYEDKNSIILQREVGQQTKSFADALKHSLRQDPDVILIGEMRDLETIQLAITAAETGHLCFGTLHTQDAPSTIDRIIDVFPPHQQQQVRIQVSTVLQAVISQTLIQRKDGKGRVCAREFMRGTTAIGSIIRDGKTHLLYSAIEAGNKFGMISMDQYLAFLVKQNHVAIEEACAVAHDAGTVRQLAGMATTNQPPA
ncbi:MAG: type IV pilus twitching motility protein PilT [Elusimicrobia bacterium]|nr:type IV pilus twitching motility protein PilT [Elusimicrobiota bacterium]